MRVEWPSGAGGRSVTRWTTLADQLRQTRHPRRYTVQVPYPDGKAELSGTTADQPQRDEALRIVQGVPGVERVVDRMTVREGSALLQVQVPAPPVLKDGPPP